MTQAAINDVPVLLSGTIPTITSASNRIVFLIACRYSGGNAQGDSALTINGQSGTLIKSDSSAQQNVAISTFAFFESQISSVQGQSYTGGFSGGSGSLSVVFFSSKDSVQNVAGINSVNGFTATNGATITLPLTRATTSLTVDLGYTYVSGQTLTMTNPARSGSISLPSGRGTLNYGTQSDTSNTANSTVVANLRTTAHAYNIQGFNATPSVVNINGGTNSVQLGSSGNTVTTTLMSSASSATLAGVAMTSLAGSNNAFTFSVPTLTDGVKTPYPSGTFVISDGTNSPSLASVSVTLPTGLVAVQLSGTLNTTNTGILYNFSSVAQVGEYIVYPNVPDVGKYTIVDAQGNLDTNLSGTQTFWHIDSGGIARSYLVITGVNGAIIAVIPAGFGFGFGFGF